MSRVVVGLSGGVDSSVAAYVLQQQGHEVIGLFMRNWTDQTGVLKGDCPWMDDKFDAEAVARKLKIPFHMVDLSKEYMSRVADYMFAEYERGRTPNPDVLCNREIKFDSFLKEALKLGAEYVATGHYCRTDIVEGADGKPVHRLLAGSDGNKDQSYFLCQLNQEQLSKAMFPIGDMLKPEVRKIAGELGLVTAHKKDSQGICFVGKVDLPVFLQQKLKAKEGKVFLIESDSECFDGFDKIDYLETRNLSTEMLEKLSMPYDLHPKYGKKVGLHQGAQYYTVGQRKGLGIGGFPEPLFVLGTNIEHNQIFVGMGDNHRGLHRQVLKMNNDEMHWVRPDMQIGEGEVLQADIRIRYRQPLQKGILVRRKEGYYVVFEEKQRGITAGQFCAVYLGDDLVASGVIDR